MLCRSTISDSILQSQDPIKAFSELLINISEETIPKTSTTHRIHKPWFNKECKDAVKTRRKAEHHFRKNPSIDNLNSYKKVRAQSRRTIKAEKRQSWHNFISKINTRTPISKVWNMVQRIKGKGSNSSIKHLIDDDNNLLTAKKDIANILAQSVSKTSSSDNYDPKFKTFKDKQEKHNINFTSDNAEDYNEPFSLNELITSLNKAKDTAVGPDDIHYQLLKHLPTSSLQTLLNIYNHIWLSGNFPPSWHDAIVVPIPKPDKDHTDPKKYR